MDRSLFLKSLRAQGYKGKATLAEVKAWMDEQGLDSAEVVDGAGTKSKVEDVWAKTAPLTLTAPVEDQADDGDETETKSADDGETKDADADAKKAAKERGKVKHNPDGRGAKALAKVAIHTSTTKHAFKKYENRIKQTAGGIHRYEDQAYFDSAEQAEEAGAFFRVQIAKAAKVEGRYAQWDNDNAILDNSETFQKSLTGATNSLGGVLVPTEFLPDLVWRSEKFGTALKAANVIPMSGDRIEDCRMTSIPDFQFTGQNAAATQVDPTFDKFAITAQKASATAYVSNELFNDSAVSIGDVFARAYAEGALKCQDKCYFKGDGTSTYGGMSGLSTALPSGAYITMANAWSGITEDHILSLIGAVENIDGGELAFYCSRQFYVNVFKRLSKASGGRTEAEFNTNKALGNAFGNADAMYSGLPVYFAQVLPTVTSTSSTDNAYLPLFLGATKIASAIGTRQEMRIATSEHVGFMDDKLAFRATVRFGLNIFGDGRVPASTYGPIVGGKIA